jgi:hypothetical protein
MCNRYLAEAAGDYGLRHFNNLQGKVKVASWTGYMDRDIGSSQVLYELGYNPFDLHECLGLRGLLAWQIDASKEDMQKCKDECVANPDCVGFTVRKDRVMLKTLKELPNLKTLVPDLRCPPTGPCLTVERQLRKTWKQDDDHHTYLLTRSFQARELNDDLELSYEMERAVLV